MSIKRAKNFAHHNLCRERRSLKAGIKTKEYGYWEEIDKAVDKQIAKKVILDDSGEICTCPRCKKVLKGELAADLIYGAEGKKNEPKYRNYCMHCGQKLEWGILYEDKSQR